MPAHHQHHQDAAAQHDHHVDFDSPEMAVFAELEGEVLVGFVHQATSLLTALCQRLGVEVRRVLDIGCGPGVGSCQLAELFPSASVVAVDGSATMLEHVTARAEGLALGPRVETRLVALPAGLPTLGRADVVWASMVLHHIGDEAAALRQVRDLLEPDGLLAVVEQAGPLRVLPDDAALDRSGLWERLDAASTAWFSDMRADLPGATTSADYPTMLGAAGLEVLADEVLTVVLDAPLDTRARRFAHQQLRSTRARLEHHAGAADLEALDALIDEDADEGSLGRDDAHVSAARHLFVARAVPRFTR